MRVSHFTRGALCSQR